MRVVDQGFALDVLRLDVAGDDGPRLLERGSYLRRLLAAPPDPEGAVRAAHRRALLRRAQSIIVERIRAAGGPDLTRSSDVWLMQERPDGQWGELEQLGDVAERLILPTVTVKAASVARAWLGWWFQQLGPAARYVRYGVATAGPRVPLHAMRDAVTAASARINRWIKAETKIGLVDFYFQSFEFTLARHQATGDVLAHPHWNLVYKPRRKLSDDELDAFLARGRRYLGAWWRDAGVVRDVRELTKYACKIFSDAQLQSVVDDGAPSAARAAGESAVALDRIAGRTPLVPIALTDLTGEELTVLEEQLYDLTRFRFRGPLQSARRALLEQRTRPRWDPLRHRYVLVKAGGVERCEKKPREKAARILAPLATRDPATGRYRRALLYLSETGVPPLEHPPGVVWDCLVDGRPLPPRPAPKEPPEPPQEAIIVHNGGITRASDPPPQRPPPPPLPAWARPRPPDPPEVARAKAEIARMRDERRVWWARWREARLEAEESASPSERRDWRYAAACARSQALACGRAIRALRDRLRLWSAAPPTDRS